MEDCHKHAAIIGTYLIENKQAFRTNDKKEIEKELYNILKRIDDIIYHEYKNIDILKHAIHDPHFPLASVLKEFYMLINLYMYEPMCIKNERVYANIFREYLCNKGAKNLTILYHFIANIGIIMAGCTRIYLVDKNKKGEIPSIISDNTFFLQHINDTSYRVSKSNVKECIKTTFKSIGLGNILMAQTLLNISQDFRNHINKFCPIIYKNWSKKSKVAHQKFENEMQELINIIDLSILGLKKSQEKMNETKNFNKK